MRLAALLVPLLVSTAFASSASAAPRFIDALTSAGVGSASAEWGGPTVASNGETVKIYFSDAYPVDPARAKQWADFLTSLIHGPELATVTVHLVPPSEVTQACGFGALACYSPHSASITAPAEDVVDELSAKGALAHEYGHHVAANRTNPPFAAINYGTKRWASYEHVCARSRVGTLHPGAEDERNYASNPGEAFAETYRVLNEQKLGLPVEEWNVTRLLFPDATALALLEQDVVDPWKRNTTKTYTARLTAQSPARTFTLRVPYDGTLSVSPRQSGAARVSVSLGARGRGSLTRTFGRAPVAALATTICGAHVYTLRVRLARGVARPTRTNVTLTVSSP